MSNPLAIIATWIDRWWMAPAPPERLAAVRILAGGFALAYMIGRLLHFLSYAHFDPGQFQPVGVLSLVLDRPLVPLAVRIITIATAACAVPFVLGWRYRVTGPLFAALLLWTLTYRHSWGMVFHTDNLLVLQVLVLGITPAADAWSLDARRRARRGHSPPAAHGRYGWPLRLMCCVVVAAYVLAGVAKLRNAGLSWLWGDELRNHIALDNARKALLGDIYSPLAAPLLRWDALFRVLALMTVVAELGAPLALLGRRVAALWVLLVVGFHLGVLALMMIAFPYQMFGFAFACFFPVERPLRRLGRFMAQRSGSSRKP